MDQILGGLIPAKPVVRDQPPVAICIVIELQGLELDVAKMEQAFLEGVAYEFSYRKMTFSIEAGLPHFEYPIKAIEYPLWVRW